MNNLNNSVDVLDILLRSQTVRQFQVQMMIQNPEIAAMQSQKLRIQLGLENLSQTECDYFIKTEAKHKDRKTHHGTREYLFKLSRHN
jgi:predicted ATPase